MTATDESRMYEGIKLRKRSCSSQPLSKCSEHFFLKILSIHNICIVSENESTHLPSSIPQLKPNNSII